MCAVGDDGSASLDIRQFYFGQYKLIGTTMDSPADFDVLIRLLDEKAVPPVPVSNVFPVADADAAHEFLRTGGGFGKVVLSIG